jgi:hypothetical protein
MNKHTPGPWKAVYVGCSDWDLSGPVTEQDWKLAAAAPDLLEALYTAEALLLSMGMQSSNAYQEIDAAIVKATGGQP